MIGATCRDVWGGRYSFFLEPSTETSERRQSCIGLEGHTSVRGLVSEVPSAPLYAGAKLRSLGLAQFNREPQEGLNSGLG